MRKYVCNNCAHDFYLEADESISCPSCGSRSAAEVFEDYPAGPVWTSKGVIISAIILLIMLVTLFLLPSGFHSYTVSLENLAGKCTFRIIVKEGTNIAAPDKFNYSLDNGGTWSQTREFNLKTPGTFDIVVVSRYYDTSKVSFDYEFTNPVAYYPTCPEAQTCECERLEVTFVDTVIVDEKKALVIRTSQPYCPTLKYSISGQKGDYQSDSLFFDFKPANYIFVKSDSCEPVAYSDNPFYTKKIMQTGFLREDQVKDKPYSTSYPQRHDLLAYMNRKLSNQGFSGSLVTRFIVEKEGTITGLSTVPTVDAQLKDDLKAWLSDLNWQPGYDDRGSSVRTLVSLTLQGY